MSHGPPYPAGEASEKDHGSLGTKKGIPTLRYHHAPLAAANENGDALIGQYVSR